MFKSSTTKTNKLLNIFGVLKVFDKDWFKEEKLTLSSTKTYLKNFALNLVLLKLKYIVDTSIFYHIDLHYSN